MYGLLLQTFIRERLSLRRLFGQKIARSKLQSVLMVGVLIYAFGVTAFSNTLLQYEIAKGLILQDGLSQMLYQVVDNLAGLGFLFGFFQAQGYLFQYKDFDLLGPLPIPQRVIIFAKISIMLVFVYLFSLIMVLPTYGVWWYVSETSFLQFFFFLPMAMVAPIPLMLLGSLVSFVLRKITQRWVHANVLQTIFSVLFILSFASFSFVSNEILPPNWLANLDGLTFANDWFVVAIEQMDIVSLLLFLLFNIVILIGFVVVMSHSILKINQQRNLFIYKPNEKVPQRALSLMSHLINKEWKRFVGTSIYFINAGFGILMLLTISIVSLFFPSTMDEFRQMIVAIGLEPLWLIFIVIGFSLSTVYTPAVSLSLEGKNINLIKSLPIQAWTIIQSKIYFNLLLTIPVAMLASVVGIYLFEFNVLHSILFLIIVILFTFLLSCFFMVLNLWFPRFDYHQEVEVVKQSLAALVAVFGGFAILGALLWLVFDPFAGFNLEIRLLIVSLVEGLGIILAGWYLRKNAERFFQSFSV